MPMLDGVHSEYGSVVRLAGAGATNQDGVIGTFDEFAMMELADYSLVDFGGGEIERA